LKTVLESVSWTFKALTQQTAAFIEKLGKLEKAEAAKKPKPKPRVKAKPARKKAPKKTTARKR
jgi:hypothetical protein